MVLLIIPGICLYFFIGSILSTIAVASGDDSDLDDKGIVEFADRVERVEPFRIKFTDEENAFLSAMKEK